MEKTLRCIVYGCRNLAVDHAGFVIKSRDRVSAGFCENHLDVPCPNAFGKRDCYGLYDKAIGILGADKYIPDPPAPEATGPYDLRTLQAVLDRSGEAATNIWDLRGWILEQINKLKSEESDPRDHPICGDDSWIHDPEMGAR